VVDQAARPIWNAYPLQLLAVKQGVIRQLKQTFGGHEFVTGAFHFLVLDRIHSGYTSMTSFRGLWLLCRPVCHKWCK